MDDDGEEFIPGTFDSDDEREAEQIDLLNIIDPIPLAATPVEAAAPIASTFTPTDEQIGVAPRLRNLSEEFAHVRYWPDAFADYPTSILWNGVYDPARGMWQRVRRLQRGPRGPRWRALIGPEGARTYFDKIIAQRVYRVIATWNAPREGIGHLDTMSMCRLARQLNSQQMETIVDLYTRDRDRNEDFEMSTRARFLVLFAATGMDNDPDLDDMHRQILRDARAGFNVLEELHNCMPRTSASVKMRIGNNPS